MKFAVFAALATCAAAKTMSYVGEAKPATMEYVGEAKSMDYVGQPELEGVIHIDRTFNTLSGVSAKLTVDKDCTSTDAEGSNDCDIHFGDTLTLTYDLALTEDIKEGAKISIDAKLDNIVPFTASCAACGANCSITIPIIKKDFNFAMPPCPIAAGSLSNTTTLTLPATSPIPIALSAKGKVTVVDDQGKTMIDADFNAALK